MPNNELFIRARSSKQFELNYSLWRRSLKLQYDFENGEIQQNNWRGTKRKLAKWKLVKFLSTTTVGLQSRCPRRNELALLHWHLENGNDQAYRKPQADATICSPFIMYFLPLLQSWKSFILAWVVHVQAQIPRPEFLGSEFLNNNRITLVKTVLGNVNTFMYYYRLG